MKKSICTLLVAITVLFAMIPFSSAVHTSTVTTEIIDLGDGYTGEVTTTVYSRSQLRSVNETVRGEKNLNVKYNGSKIGEFSLFGDFSYTGTSAKAISDSWSASARSGYSYDGDSYCSGSSVKGSCTFTGNGISKTVSLTITCDRNGNIS